MKQPEEEVFNTFKKNHAKLIESKRETLYLALSDVRNINWRIFLCKDDIQCAEQETKDLLEEIEDLQQKLQTMQTCLKPKKKKKKGRKVFWWYF